MFCPWLRWNSKVAQPFAAYWIFILVASEHPFQGKAASSHPTTVTNNLGDLGDLNLGDLTLHHVGWLNMII